MHLGLLYSQTIHSIDVYGGNKLILQGVVWSLDYSWRRLTSSVLATNDGVPSRGPHGFSFLANEHFFGHGSNQFHCKCRAACFADSNLKRHCGLWSRHLLLDNAGNTQDDCTVRWYWQNAFLLTFRDLVHSSGLPGVLGFVWNVETHR